MCATKARKKSMNISYILKLLSVPSTSKITASTSTRKFNIQVQVFMSQFREHFTATPMIVPKFLEKAKSPPERN